MLCIARILKNIIFFVANISATSAQHVLGGSGAFYPHLNDLLRCFLLLHLNSTTSHYHIQLCVELPKLLPLLRSADALQVAAAHYPSDIESLRSPIHIFAGNYHCLLLQENKKCNFFVHKFVNIKRNQYLCGSIANFKHLITL